MSVETQIKDKLNALTPIHLEVVNESHMHSVPVNSETHFKVTLVSSQFVDKKLVARHQLVYKTLAEELQNGVHALALHLYTPEEWEQRSQTAPDSPDCLGGSKKDPLFKS